jgi:hypothetical protein
MKRLIILIPIVLVLLIGISAANAQRANDPVAPKNGSYDLAWNTVDGGGDTSIGGGYALMGTIGQSDAGALINGGGFSLNGGFWVGAASQYKVYLPVVIK